MKPWPGSDSHLLLRVPKGKGARARIVEMRFDLCLFCRLTITIVTCKPVNMGVYGINPYRLLLLFCFFCCRMAPTSQRQTAVYEISEQSERSMP